MHKLFSTYRSSKFAALPQMPEPGKGALSKKREEELLSVDYFHNVFTLPHDLKVLARSNKKIIYDILFKSVSRALLEFGENGLAERLALGRYTFRTAIGGERIRCVKDGKVTFAYRDRRDSNSSVWKSSGPLHPFTLLLLSFFFSFIPK